MNYIDNKMLNLLSQKMHMCLTVNDKMKFYKENYK